MKPEKRAKSYVAEFKRVIQFLGSGKGQEKKRAQKSRFEKGMLLKTHVEKMSLFGLATMLMKTNNLHIFCYDVDENKGDRREIENGAVENKGVMLCLLRC